jgi:hypothetical protein
MNMLGDLYRYLFGSNRSEDIFKIDLPVFDFKENSGNVKGIRTLHAKNTSCIRYPEKTGCTVVRLAGCNFTKFTAGLKPHDIILHSCFIEVSKDLIKEFGAESAYTIGDNILLFFDTVLEPKHEYLLRRTEVAVTRITSYATLRFDKHLNNHIDMFKEQYSPRLAQNLLDKDFTFRAMSLNLSEETTYDYIKYVYYRATDFNEELTKNYGTIVKERVENTDEDITTAVYKQITISDREHLEDIELLLRKYINVIPISVDEYVIEDSQESEESEEYEESQESQH